MKLPEAAAQCIRRLEAAGFAAYAVGGCVRDSLLGLTPHDYDLCTQAAPSEICRIFADRPLIHNGEKHGTVGVVMDGEVYEITTFRTEGDYRDNRHPGWVRFVPHIREDLARRDFTVNAMAYSPARGYADPFGGREDLKAGILRAVGDPCARFQEDALRILRGVRFAVRFGLTVEPETALAMDKCRELMDSLAPERVMAELTGLLPAVTAEDLLRFAPVLTQAIPELAPCVGFSQHSPYHKYDVFTHIAHVTQAVPGDTVLRWAALLHDIGKPAAFYQDSTGRGHFPQHAQLGAQIADRLLRRLRAPARLREDVVFLVARHMLSWEPDKKLIRRRIGRFGRENIMRLLILQHADFAGKGVVVDGEESVIPAVQALMAQVLQEEACFAVKDLKLRGGDLIAAGFSPGPGLGSCLDTLLQLVQNEVLPNEQQALLDYACAHRAEFRDGPASL